VKRKKRWRTTVDVDYTFRLYPYEGSSLHVTALIFKTSAEMHYYVDARSRGAAWRRIYRVAGCCLGEHKDTRRVATVVFCRKHLNLDVVAHEFAHATYTFAARKGLAVQDNEEWFATTHGYLVGLFMARALSVGFRFTRP
jgi:hypothetical protein